MNLATFLYLAALVLLSTGCVFVLQIASSLCKQKEAGAYAGGQAFVAQTQAECAERSAKASAYYEQVRSMEAGWQSYLDNHFTLSGTGKTSPDDLRALRAAFENMYDLHFLETPQ